MEKIMKICKNIKEIRGCTLYYLITMIFILNLLFLIELIGKKEFFCMLTVMYLLFFYDAIKNIADELKLRDKQKNSTESRKQSIADLEKTAFHEAGHAIIARLLNPNSKIKKIAIKNIFENNIGGVTNLEYQSVVLTKSHILGEIQTLLGGLIAEELAYGEHSNGVCSDISKAQTVAMKMIQNYGMGKRLIYAKDDARAIEEAELILQNEKAKATEILKVNKNILYLLKEELMQKREINEEEIEEFFKTNGI